LTNGSKVKITNPDGLMTLNSYATDRLNDTTFTSEAISNVNLIKAFTITPNQTITVANDTYGSHLCREMVNLTKVNVHLPKNITEVGDYFCSQLFEDCGALQSLPSDFNLPQNITKVGSDFCRSMFEGTSLISLPSNFNLPQGIVDSSYVYANMCRSMFYDCTYLACLPSNFSLPMNMTGIQNSVKMFQYMFFNCSSLQSSTPYSNLMIPLNISPSGSPYDQANLKEMFAGSNPLKTFGGMTDGTPSSGQSIPIKRG
jgi:hypothetical protein